MAGRILGSNGKADNLPGLGYWRKYHDSTERKETELETCRKVSKEIKSNQRRTHVSKF